MKIWNSEGQLNRISDALKIDLPEHAIVSVVGAGGKTSLIFAWARELAAAGKKVVVTTTTHMLHPEYAGDIYTGRYIVYHPDCGFDSNSAGENFAHIDELLSESGILMLATNDAANECKVTAVPDEILYYARNAADVVLIEADGSRGMPLKYPKEHEPVIPPFSDATVCVAGLSSIGMPIPEAVYNSDYIPSDVYNHKDAFPSDDTVSHTVDELLISSIVSHPSGGLKRSCGMFRVYLNQADTPELQEKASRIAGLLELQNIDCAWGQLTRINQSSGL